MGGEGVEKRGRRWLLAVCRLLLGGVRVVVHESGVLFEARSVVFFGCAVRRRFVLRPAVEAGASLVGGEKDVADVSFRTLGLQRHVEVLRPQTFAGSPLCWRRVGSNPAQNLTVLSRGLPPAAHPLH